MPEKAEKVCKPEKRNNPLHTVGLFCYMVVCKGCYFKACNAAFGAAHLFARYWRISSRYFTCTRRVCEPLRAMYMP